MHSNTDIIENKKLENMTTITINDQMKGAQEMMELLRALDFVTSIDSTFKHDPVKLKRQKLIKYPQKYDSTALAGVAEDNPLNLVQIRKEWTKRK